MRTISFVAFLTAGLLLAAAPGASGQPNTGGQNQATPQKMGNPKGDSVAPDASSDPAASSETPNKRNDAKGRSNKGESTNPQDAKRPNPDDPNIAKGWPNPPHNNE